MATKMDSAEKAFEAATLETPAKPVAIRFNVMCVSP